jgi:FkbM family methyltransferase
MGRTVECRVGQELILLDVEGESAPPGGRNHELWRAETYATKGPDTLAWIDRSFRPGDVIYDIGANIGQYSLYAAKRLRGQCQVFALEPEALNFAKLNRNIVLNELTDCITAYCLAVADQTELGSLYVQTFAPGAALHAWGKPETQGEKAFTPQHRQGVMAVSLDDLTGRFGLPVPQHMKIDVDGLEDLIVAGAERTLRDPQLRTALIEVFMHKDVAARIDRACRAAGLQLANPDALEADLGTVRNLIYVRPEA